VKGNRIDTTPGAVNPVGGQGSSQTSKGHLLDNLHPLYFRQGWLCPRIFSVSVSSSRRSVRIAYYTGCARRKSQYSGRS
jgi:hypothetical protein